MENLSQDYVRTAFAKGLTEKRVVFFHAVRNSLIPLATGIGSQIGLFLAGSYLIEKIFGIDGIGLLTFQAIGTRDYGIIMGFLVIGVLIRLFGNLISAGNIFLTCFILAIQSSLSKIELLAPLVLTNKAGGDGLLANVSRNIFILLGISFLSSP